MLHIAKHCDKCCGTCSHWNGVRVQEDDGYVYALRHVEAVCRKLWKKNDFDRTCMPLTRPADNACHEWSLWQEAAGTPDHQAY